MSENKKPGFMARLFGRKLSVEDDNEKKERKEDKKKRLQRMQTVDPASLKKRTEDDLVDDKKQKNADNPKQLDKQKSDSSTGGSKSKSGRGAGAAGGKGGSKKPRSGGGGGGKSSSRIRKKKGKKGDTTIDVDVSKPIDWPAVPEVILAYHRKKPFLNQNEEWLLVELNEYECLVSDLDILKIIAKHSKFFEVEPDELWDEFFEFMEDVPTYDEIINYDVWQEFRDEKYPY